jgi:hypothetical protein
MSNKQKIINFCTKYNLKITDLYFDRNFTESCWCLDFTFNGRQFCYTSYELYTAQKIAVEKMLERIKKEVLTKSESEADDG